MKAAGAVSAGPTWPKGDAQEVAKLLATIAVSVDAAWDAAADDTASFELMRSARRRVDEMRQDVGAPDLDNGHSAEWAIELTALLLGARFVPDAVGPAKAHIDEALSHAGALWQHLGYQNPLAAALAGIGTSRGTLL